MNGLKRVNWNYVNPLLPSVTLLYQPSKPQIGFLMFSDGIERQHWKVKGWKRLKSLKTLTKVYIKKGYVQKDIIKKTDEKIYYKRLSLYNHCFWFLLSFDSC